MQIETDKVLSAIRRGEDSLPKLRQATGLDYAQLHPLLYKLEFEWRSIHRKETAEGFDRYYPTVTERIQKNPIESTVHTVPPAALHHTKEEVAARDLALLQRNAPYCVGCRGLCVLHGTDRTGKTRWRCRTCEVSFAGSGAVRDLSRIAPEKRQAAISAFNEAKSVRRVAAEVGISHQTAQKIRQEEQIEAVCPCGQDAKHKGWCQYRFQNSPARQATLEKMNMGHVDPEAQMRERDTLGPEEEAALEQMRDVEDLPDEPRERAVIEITEDDVVKDDAIEQAKRNLGIDKPLCGCGYTANHRGRCRDGQVKSCRQDSKLGGRPRIEVDLKRLEDSLANPELTVGQACEAAGVARNTVYGRKQKEPELAAAFDRGLLRRKEARTSSNGHDPKIGENITETITSNGDNVRNADIVNNTTIARNPTINEEQKTGKGLGVTLRKAIAEKEAQIAILESDIAALRRTVQILEM